MQDRDIPPEAEGSTNGAAVGVRPDVALVAPWDAIAIVNSKVSTPRPWITAIEQRWGTITEAAAALAVVD